MVLGLVLECFKNQDVYNGMDLVNLVFNQSSIFSLQIIEQAYLLHFIIKKKQVLMLFASTTSKEFPHPDSKTFYCGRQLCKRHRRYETSSDCTTDQHFDHQVVAFFNTEPWATCNDVLLDHSSCLVHFGNMAPQYANRQSLQTHQ